MAVCGGRSVVHQTEGVDVPDKEELKERMEERMEAKMENTKSCCHDFDVDYPLGH